MTELDLAISQSRGVRRIANELTLREFLSVPYLVEAEAVEIVPGQWIRRAAYPELPGCSAEALRIEDTLNQLEQRRIEVILEMLRAGSLPPVPRPPLEDCDPEGVAERLGLRDRVEGLLDQTGSQICAAADARTMKTTQGEGHAVSGR